MKGDSKQSHRAVLPGPVPTSVMVYVALRQLFCEPCSGFIEPGEMFTRKHMQGGGSRTFPTCRACQPWEGA